MIDDAQMAIELAECYFDANFPERPDRSGCRLEARLENGVWHVRGVLPPDTSGGCLNVRISQLDGRILRMWGEQ